MMTIAREISAQFGHNSQCWEKGDVSLVDLCAKDLDRIKHVDIDDVEQMVMYTFSDDSTITMAEIGWIAGPVGI